MYTMAKKVSKTRNFLFVLYPESMPENWLERLRESHVKMAISPLHDKDVNDDAEGELKKAHYHLIICFDGPKTMKNATEFLMKVLECPFPLGKACQSLKGAYRYLIHQDHPDKYQYDEKDVISLNGFSAQDIIELTKSEKLKIKKDLTKIIFDMQIIEYAEFMNYTILNHNDNYFEIASSNTIYFNSYISSMRNKIDSVTCRSKVKR